ncbi:hypothetical protein N474_25675 [Pseudoalteromonas luteoviolacea CPMOR-2]|uniref:metallophosphoesterase family protein n=1 Tax=Pseudoalteromonas luteoviolacea TaxID=43657 RepID=UPI0007B08E38|nr:metallophosphoesterase [Pseudoalteromonas luteoviolacea]KZN57700.1 hypothetical protein N474_25675 [Pseudoalteromonas luteoviolacea CPMOR-2]
MSSSSLKIAVVSDLHFVNSSVNSNSKNHSWLTFDSEGNFTNNFWSTLIGKIEQDSIKADILVCPGDITTHAEGTALKFAWGKLNELAKKLDCKLLATATGNHDVNSRGLQISNPVRDLDQDHSLVENLKQLSPEYPLVDLSNPNSPQSHEDRINYFGSNFLFSPYEDFNLVILNSCANHINDTSAFEKGFVSQSTHAWLEMALHEHFDPKKKKLGILVCHHHPIQHSDHKLGTYDFMNGGTQLIEMLNKYGNWIIIHGHKHHGKLSYHMDGGSKKTVVFAAGTLSSHKEELGDNFTNQFYVIDMGLKSKGTPKGTLDVYSWQGNHWALSKRREDGIFTGVGFGDVGCLESLAEDIASKVQLVTGTEWSTIVEQFSEIKHCVPKDFEHLERNLQALGVDIITNQSGEIGKLEKSEE